MRYQGSKRLLVKHLKPILEDHYIKGMTYIEPFVGGGNMIIKLPFPHKVGIDYNEHIINMLKIVRDDPTSLPSNYKQLPPKLYYELREDPSNPWYGYLNSVLTFGCGWRNNYCMTDAYYERVGRDQIAVRYNQAQRESDQFKGVELVSCSYDEYVYPDNSLIYCDPPYKGTAGYQDEFNHEVFYEWCRVMTLKGHTVLISEYDMPKDFKVLWEKERNANMNGKVKSTIEKLFMWEGLNE